MIKIAVDSASDVELLDAKTMGITLVSMQVRFGGDEYLDGVNLTHRQFFEKLIESAELPQTSQINEFVWEENFRALTADGSDVIAITISSKLSGTYSCAVKAAKKFDGKVRVVDSAEASLGERILLDYALQLVKDGVMSAREIEIELNEKKKKIQLIAVLDTLKYLRKGGRISSVAAIAGELLTIKPVISIVNGEIKMLGKAIGSKKSNNLLNQLVEKCGGIDFDMPYAVAYSGLHDEYLQKYLKDSAQLWQGHTERIPAYMIGCTIGTHVGPNAIAVAFYSK